MYRYESSSSDAGFASSSSPDISGNVPGNEAKDDGNNNKGGSNHGTAGRRKPSEALSTVLDPTTIFVNPAKQVFNSSQV